MFADNSLHGQFNAALLFGGFSFRYADNVTNIDYFEERLPEQLHQQLSQVIAQLGGDSVPKEASGTVNETITFHTLDLGYRFYLPSLTPCGSGYEGDCVLDAWSTPSPALGSSCARCPEGQRFPRPADRDGGRRLWAW